MWADCVNVVWIDRSDEIAAVPFLWWRYVVDPVVWEGFAGTWKCTAVRYVSIEFKETRTYTICPIPARP